MSGFLYFFPKTSEAVVAGELQEKVLKQYALDHVFDRKRPEEFTIASCRGPNEAAGWLVYPIPDHGKSPPMPYTYNPDKQGWTKCVVDIGWDKANPPTPDDLARAYPALDGLPCRDRRGRQWIIPIIRSDRRNSSLPVDYGYDENLKIRVHLQREYEELWNDAGEALDYLMADMDSHDPKKDQDLSMEDRMERWPIQWLMDFCTKLLGVNYRIGPNEVQAFKEESCLLDTQLSAQIIQAAVDWSHIFRASEEIADSKKKVKQSSGDAGLDERVATESSA